MSQPDGSSFGFQNIRRHPTLLFSDLNDSTPLVGGMEPEDYADLLNHIKRTVRDIVRRQNGTVIDIKGDGFLAMFGYPEPNERDWRSATEAALELHEAIGSIPSPIRPGPVFLSMHSGIHSGLVVLKRDDGELSVYGEAIHVASRLCDLAQHNEILITATTLGTESHFFHVRERPNLVLKGKAESVTAYQVMGRAPITTRFQARVEHGLTAFAGRLHEIGVLERGLHDAINGRLQTIAVVGAAGIGKTRLVEEFLTVAAARACDVHRGYCEDHRSEPLQPFRQMLRAMAAPPPTDNTPAALRELFSTLATTNPRVIFIDDWHWADDASRQVVAAIRELADRRILIVTTSRPTHQPQALGDWDIELLLSPLEEEYAAQMIRALRANADPFVIRHFQERSGGNPLFIEELCHSASRDIASGSADRVSMGPAWLSNLIESRVERLPVAKADLVRTAAIIGKVVPLRLLEQVTGCAAGDPFLHELAERDLIYPGEVEGTLRFKHGITRDVIYASVGLREREAVHLRIAALLEQSSDESQEALLEPLSYHFRAGGDQEHAAHYAELAGDKAEAAAAPDRARIQYAAAMAALERMEASDERYRRWSRIVHHFGLACVFDPTRDQLAVFYRAAELADQNRDQSGVARAEYWLGFIRYALGESGAAIDHYERARTSCSQAFTIAMDAGDQQRALEMEALRVQLLAATGLARAATGEHDVALGLLDEALVVKRRHRRTARPAVGSAYALACKGAVLGELGRFAAAYQCFDEALEAGAGHLAVEGSVVGWRSAVYLWHGRWNDARDSAMRAQILAQRVGSLYVLAMGQSVAAYATWMLEKTPSSIDVIARAASWLETRDKRLSISMNYGWLADVAAAMSEVSRARTYAARAIRRARMRDPLGEGMSYRALASLPSRRRPRLPDAYMDLAMRSAIARRCPREQAVTLLHQARHAAQVGPRADAYRLLERARSAFASMDMRWHDDAARQCLAELDATPSRT